MPVRVVLKDADEKLTFYQKFGNVTSKMMLGDQVTSTRKKSRRMIVEFCAA